MIAVPRTKPEALEALGLPPEAGPDAIKAAFRARAKSVHPDMAPPTPDSLTSLASAIAAMRILERDEDLAATLEISAREAASGTVRLVPRIGGNLIVRISAGTQDGAWLTAIGETALVQIRVRQPSSVARLEDTATPLLPAFVERFAGKSPATRFAGWLRRRPPAA